jgi:hypothetical protein
LKREEARHWPRLSNNLFYPGVRLPSIVKVDLRSLFKKPAGKEQKKVKADQTAGQRFEATPLGVARRGSPQDGG